MLQKITVKFRERKYSLDKATGLQPILEPLIIPMLEQLLERNPTPEEIEEVSIIKRPDKTVHIPFRTVCFQSKPIGVIVEKDNGLTLTFIPDL